MSGNSPSHVGGSRSGPVQGIQLPEDDIMDLPITNTSPFQLSGDQPVDVGPVTVRVENDQVMHISDSALRNYKLNEVDSDGTSRIAVTPAGSSRNVYNSSLSSGTRNPASSSSGPSGTTASSGLRTETTRQSSSRTNWNTDEVIQPGTPNRSAVNAHQNNSQKKQGDVEQGKDGFESRDFEQSTQTKSSDKTPSYTLELENNGSRWFAFGVVALLLIGGGAIAAIVLAKGGGEENPSPAPTIVSGNPLSTPAPTVAAEPVEPSPTATTPGTDPSEPETEPETEPATEGEEEQVVVEPTIAATASPTDATVVEAEITPAPTVAIVTDSPTATATIATTTLEPTSAPTIATTTQEPTTIEPTSAAPTSLSPTGAPVTMGPTSIVPGLPEETLAKQGDLSTPQGLAFLFVEGYPGFADLPDWRKQQLFGMAAYFNSFNGRSWPLNRRLNWLNANVHECEWNSLSAQPCDLEDRLEFLGLLNDDTLAGSMAPEVGLLTDLEELSIEVCGLAGNATTVFPSELATLTNLRSLSFARNALRGTVPSAIASLSSLQFLRLQSNQWTGTLPAEWSNLSFLREIDVSDTGLTGTVPAALAALTNLESLIITGTQLSGAIPPELCNMASLTITADCGTIECC